MYKHERQQAVREMRGKIWSPGRPSTARREHRVGFWKAIARGLTSEDAAAEVGMSSAFGARSVPGGWRHATSQAGGGVGPLPVIHRARGDRDPARAEARCPRDRPADRAFTVDDLPGAAPERVDPHRRAGVPGDHGAVARRAASEPTQGRQARSERPAARVRRGPPRRQGQATRWQPRARPRRQVHRPPARSPGDRRWATAWSPEQISNRLRIDFPDDESMRISHEAIYQALYIQGRGALRRELVACLRTGRALRVPRARSRERGKKFVTPELLISERPAEAKSGRSRGTGRATSSWAWRAPQSARSSNERPGSRCCCTCPAWKATATGHA